MGPGIETLKSYLQFCGIGGDPGDKAWSEYVDKFILTEQQKENKLKIEKLRKAL